MGPCRGVSVMVSVVLILLVLILAGSALLVLYGRSATRSSEGRLLSSLQTEFLDLQSSLWSLKGGEEVRANLRLSAEEPLLSAWKGRAGSLRLVPSGALYMRRIAITNPKSYPLYYFPVKIELNTSNFDFSRVRKDGGDIRFYRGEVPLRYYVERWDYPNSAVIWVNVPYLPPRPGTENVEMYYGMVDVESTSDPRVLWLIMEDMSAPPSGTLKRVATGWYARTALPEYVGGRGYVRLTANRKWQNGQLEYQLGYQLNPVEGFLARFEFWAGLTTTSLPGSEGADATWLYAYCTSTPQEELSAAGGYHFVFDEYDDQLQLFWNGSSLTAVGRTDIDNMSWHSVEIRHWREATGENIQIWYDGSLVLSYLDSIRNKTGTLFGWGARTGENTNEHRIRNLYVRKYTNPEPQAWVGAEERVSGGPFLGMGGMGFGSLEVEARGWFTPATTFILEGGAVLVEDAGGCRMLSPPHLLVVGGENTLTVTHVLVGGPSLSLSCLGGKKLRLRCTGAWYRERPLEGPNRENVVLDLSTRVRPGHRGAWQRYLEGLRDELNSRGLNATLSGLTLAVLGKNTSAGVKDLYYYERVVEVEVEALS